MKKLLACVTLTTLLVACGDETETVVNRTVNQSVLESVEKTSDLKSCVDSLDGDVVFVVEKQDAYVCADGEWLLLGSSTKNDYKCGSQLLEDSTGYKIVCAGDSIGVVLNGEKGDQGKEGEQGAQGAKGVVGLTGPDGVGCYIASADDSLAYVVCGEDTTKVPLVIEEDVAYEDLKLKGFSQKGPLVKGASVVAYEIRDGKTLMQTGKSYMGLISNDSGFFNISCVTLASQYVLLKATGYYRNEVTGKISDAKISLNALTDVSDRSSANVNILTHLEYERVKTLVLKKDMGIKKAKKQALEEILGAFHMKLESVGYAEDASILGESEESAALLALSLVLQADRDVADLTELFVELSEDFADDGKLNNDSLIDEFAEWAMSNDMSGNLAFFRSNMEKWNVGKIPNFEKYVRQFWHYEKKFDDCNGDNDGDIIDGKFGKVDVKYVCDNYRWRVLSSKEKAFDKLCLATNEGEKLDYWNLSYVCASSAWRLTKNGEHLGNIVDPRDGRVYNTVKIGTQTWFAENLLYSDSVASPNLKGQVGCKNTSEEYRCEEYGALYTWSALLNLDSSSNNGYSMYGQNLKGVKDICPAGWHVPDTTEWKIMFSYISRNPLCDETFAEIRFPRSLYKRMEKYCLHVGKYKGYETNGTDVFGFSIYPSGYDYHAEPDHMLDWDSYEGDFGYNGTARFWVKSMSAELYTQSYYVEYQMYPIREDIKDTRPYLGIGEPSFTYTNSIRCLMD